MLEYQQRFELMGPAEEWLEWEQEYLPPKSVGPHDLIVDVGAREGDTLAFYAWHGFRNFRLIEPLMEYVAILQRNQQRVLAAFPGDSFQIEVITEPFRWEHLEGAAFVKFDCEGCETAVDLERIPVPWVAEMHDMERPAFQALGSVYRESLGYRRGGGA